MPQQYEVIDIEDQGSGALSGLGDAILWIFKAEELFYLNYAHNERPERWSRSADAVRG